MSHSITQVRTALLLAMAVPACSESTGSTLDPSPSFATRTEQNNVREDFVLDDVDNPCTSEIEAVDLEGTIHGQGSVWDNDHFVSHYNVTFSGRDADGVSYFGVSTGTGKGESPGSDTEDVVISTLLIGGGGVPNFIEKIVLHHHKDGTVTVDRAAEECRG
jgi:hypothetical protein